jgi:hypothetical protein
LKNSAGSHTLSKFFKADQQRFQLIVITVTRIAQLFADVHQLEDVYRLNATADSDATTIPKKESFFRT